MELAARIQETNRQISQQRLAFPMSLLDCYQTSDGLAWRLRRPGTEGI